MAHNESNEPKSQRHPSAIFADELPPLVAPNESPYINMGESQFRMEQYERVQQSGAHLSGHLGERWPSETFPPETPTAHAREMAYDAECRATRGGLPDAPDDGPRAVSSTPFSNLR